MLAPVVSDRLEMRLVFLSCLLFYGGLPIKRLFLRELSLLARGGKNDKNEPGLEVVGQANDGQQAIKLAHELVPDVILNGYQHARGQRKGLHGDEK